MRSGYSPGRLCSYPQYDYGFFGDHPTLPTKFYVVNENGNIIARNISVANLTSTIQGYLASGKHYYFGHSLFTFDPYQVITFGSGFTFLVALNLKNFPDIRFTAHPKAVLKMKTATYADIGTSRLQYMFYLHTCENIKFDGVAFDGNLTGMTGDATQGIIFLDNDAGYGLSINGCKFIDCLYAVYGDPTESKGGVLNPDADFGCHITNNIFEDCEGAFALHNGPGGAVISGNIFQDMDRLPALFIDSCSEVVISGNIFRNCENPLSIFDGGYYCNVSDNIFETQYNNEAGQAIKVVKGEAAKTPCAHIKIHHNQILGFQNCVISDSTVNIEVTDNTFLIGSAASMTVLADGPDGVGVFDCRNNVGYIAPGEVRTLRGTIATLTENAYNSILNPFDRPVAILSVVVNVETSATATSPNIDIGIGPSATADYATLFDDLPGETEGFYDSRITTPGAQTLPQLWEHAAGNNRLNMSIKGSAATGMVAEYVITVMGLSVTDPTLGSLLGQTIGSGEKTWTYPDFGASDVIYSQKFTVAAGADLTVLRANAGVAGTSMKLALYSDLENAPNTLLAHTNAITCVDGWNSGDVVEGSVTVEPGDYWLAVKQNQSGIRGIYSAGASQYVAASHGDAFPATMPATAAYFGDLALAGWGYES